MADGVTSDKWKVTSDEPPSTPHRDTLIRSSAISTSDPSYAANNNLTAWCERENMAERKAEGYRDLLVWQKSMRLTKEVYAITRTLPREEQFVMVTQMRRAAISIPSNIAEGQARHTTREFVQFISHAEGSLAELDTQLRLAVLLGYTAETTVGSTSALLAELKKMLNALRRRLQAD